MILTLKIFIKLLTVVYNSINKFGAVFNMRIQTRLGYAHTNIKEFIVDVLANTYIFLITGSTLVMLNFIIPVTLFCELLTIFEVNCFDYFNDSFLLMTVPSSIAPFKKIKSTGVWKHYYKPESLVNGKTVVNLSENLIKRLTTSFWKDIMMKLDISQFVGILLKIEFVGGIHKTIGTLQFLTPKISNKKVCIKNFIFKLDSKQDSYQDIPILNVYISYKLFTLNNVVSINPTVVEPVDTKIAMKMLPTSSYPTTMDLDLWRLPLEFINDSTAYAIVKNIHYIFNITTKSIEVTIKDIKSGNILDKFTDTIERDIFSQGGLDCFTRIFFDTNNRATKSFSYINGSQVFYEESPNNNFITPLQKDALPIVVHPTDISPVQISLQTTKPWWFRERDSKGRFLKRMYSTSFWPLGNITPCPLPKSLKMKGILTLDYESRKNLITNELEIISCVIYDGSNYKSFYLTDYTNSQELIIASIHYLLNPIYKGSNVYIHNLSNFDGVFMLKHIASLKTEGYNVNIIYKDGKIISINISKNEVINTKNKSVASINIIDSLSLLPASLAKLAVSFNVGNKLDYDTSSHDTADLTDNDFKTNLLEYNSMDCKLLYDIIVKFNQEIESMFNITIKNTPTLSSLAFKIFRSNFLGDTKIPITSLEMYRTISEGYRGGAVDVYRPYGENLYYYDVNSLYPSVMFNKPFPTGNHKWFYGNKDLNTLFGIIYAEIEAPVNMYAPFLLTKIGDTTVAPVGHWEGWYCSEELKMAVSYGYKVNVIKGYRWDSKDYIFKDYVNTLYDYRLKYPKTDIRNQISKLLLNSLYGRFGMSPELINYEFIKDDKLDRKPVDCITLNSEGIDMYGFNSFKNRQMTKTANPLLISTPMAMFVTAYARMFMAQYKLKYQDNLYYTDTDSLVLDCPLPEAVINNKLGNFKLEYKVAKGVFLAAKTYSLLLEDGSEVTKIKGSKEIVSFNELEKLLVANSKLIIKQQKFFKSLDKATIKVLEQAYSLTVTGNKRELVYKDNKFIDTFPFII